MKLTEFRRKKEWTWENIVSLGSLLCSSNLTQVTEADWHTAHDELKVVNFISDSINAHCSEAARAEYVKAGLCKGIRNGDNCPGYFLETYLYVYRDFQKQSTILDGMKPRIYCKCRVGNCLDCKCKKEKQLCSIYCHGGFQINNQCCRNRNIMLLDLKHEAKVISRKRNRIMENEGKRTKK